MPGGPVTAYKMNVGDGWAAILDRMDAELQEVIPGYSTLQVKEKFGTLRVYIECADSRAYDIIRKWEAESAKTCEQCGEPGILWTDRAWLLTLCGGCAEKRRK